MAMKWSKWRANGVQAMMIAVFRVLEHSEDWEQVMVMSRICSHIIDVGQQIRFLRTIWTVPFPEQLAHCELLLSWAALNLESIFREALFRADRNLCETFKSHFKSDYLSMESWQTANVQLKGTISFQHGLGGTPSRVFLGQHLYASDALAEALNRVSAQVHVKVRYHAEL